MNCLGHELGTEIVMARLNHAHLKPAIMARNSQKPNICAQQRARVYVDVLSR